MANELVWQESKTRPAVSASTPETARERAPRNTVIDVLRGYCIVMMIVGHTGAGTYLFDGVHFLRHISGAEGFLFLSGLVLGLVSSRRMATMERARVFVPIWKRAAMLWAVHCVMVIAALALNPVYFHFPGIPDVSAIPKPELLWMIGTLRLQPALHLNILPIYVVLLGLAPLLLEAMRRGGVLLVAAGSVGLFVASQFRPGLGLWVDPICGGEEFPIVPWQVLFVGGLCVGFHYEAIRRFAAPRRRTLLWALSVLTAAITLAAVTQISGFTFYDRAAWDDFLWSKNPLRFGRVLFFLISLPAIYLAVQSLRARYAYAKFWSETLAVLGRNSLYSFLVHIGFVFAIGMVAQPNDSPWILEMRVVGVLASVFLMAKLGVGRRLIPN